MFVGIDKKQRWQMQSTQSSNCIRKCLERSILIGVCVVIIGGLLACASIQGKWLSRGHRRALIAGSLWIELCEYFASSLGPSLCDRRPGKKASDTVRQDVFKSSMSAAGAINRCSQRDSATAVTWLNEYTHTHRGALWAAIARAVAVQVSKVSVL